MAQPLEIHAEQNNLIVLKFTGDLLEDQITSFISTLAIASITINHLFKDHSKKVKVLLDMTNFTGNYKIEAFDALTDFAQKNTPFVEKSASFGGSDKVKATGEVVTEMAHRNNIKIFNTEQEARAWLAV